MYIYCSNLEINITFVINISSNSNRISHIYINISSSDYDSGLCKSRSSSSSRSSSISRNSSRRVNSFFLCDVYCSDTDRTLIYYLIVYHYLTQTKVPDRDNHLSNDIFKIKTRMNEGFIQIYFTRITLEEINYIEIKLLIILTTLLTAEFYSKITES